MFSLFIKGGPIMWPILLASIVSLTVVLERLFFVVGEMRKRDQESIENILSQVKAGDTEQALITARDSRDGIAKVLAYGLGHDEQSLSDALAHAANEELNRYERGLSILDTIITLAPLLGLLGTVTGMIHAFGLMGASELDAPAAITGGIAEALIATAFGLGVAILSLIPFNWLNANFERKKRQVEHEATQLELIIRKAKNYETSAIIH
jgi:biopolymer transport protein ExbB